jgi:murein tripeptide amidase MpaA
MVNPDGVFLGNHRTGVLGQDLNRMFRDTDLELYPEIEAVLNLVIEVQRRQRVAFVFDLHGHSAKKNIFAFGEECDSGSSRYLFSRIIPKLLADSLDSFKYDHCVFKNSKEKATTARLYLSSKYGFNSITF